MKEDGLLMHKNRIYVPISGELRNLVLKEMHNVSYVGHLRYQKTIAEVRSHFSWPGMKKDVVDYISRCMECQRVKTITIVIIQFSWPGMKKNVFYYISRCMECQRVKVEHRQPVDLLQPLPMPKKKWEVVTIDFITNLPRTTRQHDSIMEVVDKLTKVVHFVLVKMTHTTNNIVEIYIR